MRILKSILYLMGYVAVIGVGATRLSVASDRTKATVKPVSKPILNPSTVGNSANSIENGENDLSSTIANLLPSVVSIKAMRTSSVSLEKNGKNYNYIESNFVTSSGSGFIISKDGYVVTNNHLVDDSDTVLVNTPMGELEAEIIGSDKISDIALLKVKPSKDLPFLELKRDLKYRVGETVVVIGNPYNLGISVSKGIISALNRNLEDDNYDNLIQTDAAINRGNSGGPMFNTSGDIIGMNSVIFSPDGGNVGIGFAIPTDEIIQIVEKLKDIGYIQRGWIGITAVDFSSDVAKIIGSKRKNGVLVKHLSKGGAAEQGGIQLGDVIVYYNGTIVNSSHQLTKMIRNTAVGASIEVIVLRQDRYLKRLVSVQEMPFITREERLDKDIRSKTIEIFDMEITEINSTVRERYELPNSISGLYVLSVKANGVADQNGIKKGDLVLAANQTQLKNIVGIQAVLDRAKLNSAESILLIVRKDNSNNALVILPVR